MNPLCDDCFGDNATFRRENRRHLVILLRRQDESDCLHACLDDLEGALARSDLRKDTRSTKAGILELADGKAIFIKRYNHKGLRHSLRYLFRWARPFRAWAAAWACERQGVPTPRPLAAVVGKRAGLLREAWLVCAAVPDPVPTLVYARQLLLQPGLRQEFIAQLCAMLARMHAAGVRHGDPKLSNIYACRADRGFQFGLWDLDGASLRPEPLGAATRRADLARTVASLVEIAARLGRPLAPEATADAFLRAYRQAAGCDLPPSGLLRLVWHHLRQ